MDFKAIIAAAAISALPAAVGAATVDSTNWGSCEGNTSCTVGGISIAASAVGASAAPMAEQDFAGLLGLGVAAPNDNKDEIEALFSEAIFMDFSSFDGGGIGLHTIQLGHFYNSDDFASDPAETAIIAVKFADDTLTNVTVQTISTNPDSFTFSDTAGLGLNVTKESDSQGLYTLSNLFGGKDVATLTFSAALIGDPRAPDNSDYTIASLSTVPLPAAGWMLLAGLGGMAAMKRRRQKS